MVGTGYERGQNNEEQRQREFAVYAEERWLFKEEERDVWIRLITNLLKSKFTKINTKPLLLTNFIIKREIKAKMSMPKETKNSLGILHFFWFL